MISPLMGGFRPADLPEHYEYSKLQRSMPVGERFERIQDINRQIDTILRGDYTGADAAGTLSNLQTDLMFQIARTQTSSGVPIREDLEAPALKIIPMDTPVRNKLPRTMGSSTASSWYQQSSVGGGYGVNTTVTSGTTSATQTVGSTAGMQPGVSLYFATAGVYAIVSSVTNSTTVVLTASITTTTNEVVTQAPYSELGQNPVQAFFGESSAPATASASYTKKTATYKLLGTLYQITGLAMAAGATYQNQLAEEKLAAIHRLMLIEEFSLIQGSSTNTAAPFGDGTNAYGFDGLLNLITTSNGVPGPQVQTSVGALTVAHIDAQLTRIHISGGMNPYIVCNAQESQSLAHLATGSGSVNRIMGTTDGGLVLGATVLAYIHPITGQRVPIMTSRFMPAGTMIFCSEANPDGSVAADVRVLPQVQLPELAPNQAIQGYVAQELAPAVSTPQVYPGLVSVYEVLRMKNANVFAKSTGITAV